MRFDESVRDACLQYIMPGAANWVIEYCDGNWWCKEWLRTLPYTLIHIHLFLNTIILNLDRARHRHWLATWPNSGWTMQHKQLGRSILQIFRFGDSHVLEKQKVRLIIILNNELFRIFFKRIDVLASLILFNFLAYFRYWGSDREARPSEAHIAVTRRGHDIWASGNIFPSDKPYHYKVYYIGYVAKAKMNVKAINSFNQIKREAKILRSRLCSRFLSLRRIPSVRKIMYAFMGSTLACTERLH